MFVISKQKYINCKSDCIGDMWEVNYIS